VANLVYERIRSIVPVTCEAFEDFRLGAVTFSRIELEALKDIIKDPMSTSWRVIAGKGENQEFHEKMKILGL
jgi:thymidylate synthase (FAD)